MTKNTYIILQPEYVGHFKCDGAKCNAKCCKNWRIDIDIDTYKKYQRIKNPNIRKKILSSLEPNIIQKGYMQVKLNSDGACPLICSDNLCYIQRNFGADALAPICQSYPRFVRYIGDCQLRTLSMTCPIATEAALFSENGMDIKNILPGSESNSWKIALQCEKMIDAIDTSMATNVILGSLSILQNNFYTLEQRMVILGLFLDKSDELKNLSNGAEVIADLALFYSSDDFRMQIQDIFANWVFYPTAHGQLLAGILNFLQEKKTFSNVSLLVQQAQNYEERYVDFRKLTDDTFGTAINRYWQHEFLCHGFPFFMKGSFLHNYFAYLIAYKVWEMYLYGFYYAYGDKITKNDFLDLVTRYSKKLDHMNAFVDYLVKYTAPFEAEPIKLMQVLLRLN